MIAVTEQTYSFADFEVDAKKRLLLKNTQVIALNSKAFDLLIVLIENRGQIVNKEELLETVWANQFVEENNLTVHISALRKIFGEKRGEHQFIATIPGKGYKFVAELKEEQNEIIIKNHSFSRIIIEEETKDSFNNQQISSIGEFTGNGNKLEKSPFALPSHFIDKNLNPISWKPFLIVLGGLGLLSILIGGAYFGRQTVQLNSSATNSFSKVSIKQLTTNGKVVLAALAPDGKTFAYVVNDFGLRSLWIGYVEGGNHLLLHPATADARYFNLTFAHDFKHLYFSYKDDKISNPALFRMPVSGGVQEKVLDNIDNFALSSDGRQIVFTRPEIEKQSLFVVDLDGKEQREIVSFPKNESFVFDSISWSPDDKKLAFSKLKDSKSLGNDLAILEISSGKVQLIESEIWRDTAKTVWLEDGSNVIVHAIKHDSWASAPQYHLFQVAIPSGNTQQITNDLSGYGLSLNLSQKSDAILTIEQRQMNNIWIAPSDKLSEAKQITFGSFGKYDGLWGLDFTPDGKIIYVNSDTQSQFISEMNADGNNSKPLTAPGMIDSVLNISNDGRYIVFHSNRNGGEFDIWRSDINGSNPKQLTFGKMNFQPYVSPDNKWVYYKSWEKSVGELRRVSIDGGEPEILNNNETSWLSFSPNGKYFAASYKTDKTRLAIFDATTNEVFKQFDFPKNGTMSLGSRWSPDSSSVAFRDWNDGLWLQPI